MKDQHSSSVLFEFDTLFNIDLGIIKLIQKKYYNKNVFLDYVLDGDDYLIKCLLFENETYNPLNIILRSSYKNQANDLLNKLLSEHIDEIYSEYLEPFSTIDMINLYNLNADNFISIYIYCKSDKEEEFIKNAKLEHITIVREAHRRDIDITDIDNIYVKKYEDILEYNKNQLKAKYVSIIRYNFNLEYDKKSPLVTVSTVIGDINKIRIIMPYANFVLPCDEYDENKLPKEDINNG